MYHSTPKYSDKSTDKDCSKNSRGSTSCGYTGTWLTPPSSPDTPPEPSTSEKQQQQQSGDVHRVFIRQLNPLVNPGHLMEIFGIFGTVTLIELPMLITHQPLNCGTAVVGFKEEEAATQAAYFMNDGQIGGRQIKVTKIVS